jgi:acyl dehydratase
MNTHILKFEVSARTLRTEAMSGDKMPVADLAKHVGEEIGVSSWIALDQSRINEFAHCTGDHQWIHLDGERAAREGPFGGTVAHGFLTLALVAPTGFEVLVEHTSAKSVVIYGVNKVRFLASASAITSVSRVSTTRAAAAF